MCFSQPFQHQSAVNAKAKKMASETSQQQASTQRVSQLEATLATGDTKCPEVTMGFFNLYNAGWMLSAKNEQNWLPNKNRAKHDSSGLRNETSQKTMEPNFTTPTPPPNWAAELQ